MSVLKAVMLFLLLGALAVLSPGMSMAQTASEFLAITPADPTLAIVTPTMGPVTVPFQNNSNNPTGNTIGTMPTPKPSVTVTITNLAYSTASNFATHGLSIGGNQSGFNRYSLLNIVGGGRNNHFTSIPVNTAGTGISITANYGLVLENAPQGLSVAGAAGAGRFRVADLVIDFSVPVQDPVLHISGLGGSAGGKNFSSEFTFVSAQSVGVTSISKLSGNFMFTVSGNDITHAGTGTNMAASCGTATSGAAGACGSVRFSGNSVSRIYLQVYLSSTQTTAWPTTGADAFLLGISGEYSDMSPTVTLPAAMATSVTAGTTYTGLNVTCTNAGPNTARNALCQPYVSYGTVSALSCTPTVPAVRTPGQTISCSFSYVLNGASPLPTSVSFAGQTSSNSDLNGAQVLTEGNNMSAVTTKPSVTPAFIQATKTVSVFSEDGSGCATIPGTPVPGAAAALPGACVEYVITLTNRGTTDATNISMQDILGSQFTYVGGTRSGFNESTAGFAFTTPASGANCALSTCTVALVKARLALNQTGVITLRAKVN